MNAGVRGWIAVILVVAVTATVARAVPASAESGKTPATPGISSGHARGGVGERRPFLSSSAGSEAQISSLSRGSGNTTGLLASGAGLVGGISLAIWLKNRADDRYERYLRTADPDLARELQDSAERYDRATLIGWGLAQASFVGLIYFITREDERPLIPVEGKPVIRPYSGGVEVGIQVRP